MSLARVVVTAVIVEGRSKTQVAKDYGVARSWVSELLKRFEAEGEATFEPRSRRPHSNPRTTSGEMEERILFWRKDLAEQGHDAGAHTISYHLAREAGTAPAISTIWKVLKRNGLVVATPKKRPHSSYTRFEASQPNETWQSDFTHWRLSSGIDVEIINWLDDHSRLLLHCAVFKAITGKIVIDSFNACRNEYGTPFSTLTDNGNVYTARFTQGKNGFEYLLSELEIVQKNGSPGHPQTQGKIERFHQTQKKWLSQQKPVKTMEQLQVQLDEFRSVYNTQRPHRALEMKTPQRAYESTIKATPKQAKEKEHYRVRNDRIDQFGKLSLRRAGKMHHLGVGIHHSHKVVIMIVDHFKVSVVEKKTGEVISQHEIDPSRSYWTNLLVEEEVKKSRKRK